MFERERLWRKQSFLAAGEKLDWSSNTVLLHQQQPEALRAMAVGTVPPLPASAGFAKSQGRQGAGRLYSPETWAC